jgi:hypothetical protein
MRSAAGPFLMEPTYAWERSDEWNPDVPAQPGEPTGFARVTSPVMERAMRRATSKDLSRLKAIL